MNESMFYDLRGIAALAPSLSTQIAREIGRRIVAGTYGEGELIEDETNLAERYRVSRTAIRDAVKILSGKGLLEARRGIGTLVKPRNEWMLLDNDVLAWYQSAAPSREFLRQLMEVRHVFEPMAAFWAAQRAGDADVDKIRTAFHQMEEEKGSIEDFILADAMFHRAILNSTNNAFMSAIEGVVFSALLVSINITNQDPRDNNASIPFHRDVAEAIGARDADRARRCMENLLADAKRRLDESAAISKNAPTQKDVN
ncbi:MAG: FadR/GntR family transcriptional regulator [Gammaproteobacteria bacterium]